MNPTLARLRRLLVMVPWLLEHPGVHVEEVAERFETDPGEILDDLDVLGYCGLPGYGGGDLVQVAISGGRIAVRMAEFFARPLALSMREGLSLLMAARAARDSGVLSDPSDALDSAIDKLQRHLGGPDGLPVAMDLRAGGAELLAELMPAVQDHRVLRLTYRSASKDETTVREVEPWALRSHAGAWYLQGHCRLAGDTRSFRLDRIRQAEPTGEVATPPDDVDLRPPEYEPSPEDPEVVLDVPAALAWVSDQVVVQERHARSGGAVRLRFRAATLDWAARLVIQLGPSVVVVEPPELAELVAVRAQAALVNYDHG